MRDRTPRVARTSAGRAAVRVLVIVLSLAVIVAVVLAWLAQHPRLASASAQDTVVLRGMDLHDGTVLQAGDTDWMYGTRYGCGYEWGKTGPWCGFGVSHARSLTGPWSEPVLLFSPKTVIEANWKGDDGRTWSAMCGTGGDGGCFNPRMIHAPDGRWLLWFNASEDRGRNANPYWVMTCKGPGGPCSHPHKPAIWGCSRGGDFSLAVEGRTGYLICAYGPEIERLAPSDMDGTPAHTGNIGPGTETEGPGVWHTASGYEATFSDPNCGYCSGPPLSKAAAAGATEVRVGYSTAPSLMGPWKFRGELGGYCTGQPRTAFSADGQAWEWVDRWDGKPDETTAPVALIPFSMSPWTCAAATGRRHTESASQ
jgi:hypothetical protein